MSELITDASDLQVDYLVPQKGGSYVGHGSVAKALLANNMNVNALRTNATLQYDEWKAIDSTVRKISDNRLRIAGDLISRGLTYKIKNGMGSTILQWQTESDFEDADISMDAQTRKKEDRVTFTTHTLPLPIVHKDFHISLRTLQASRTTGDPLDTLNAERAARKVSEKIDKMILGVTGGGGTYKFSDATLYGMCDHTNRSQQTISEAWDTSACSGTDILDDVLTAITTLNNAKQYGPFVLYVNTSYMVALYDDHSANYGKSILQRLKEIDVLEDIRVADNLASTEAVLVQMTPGTIRLAVGMQPTTVEWEEQGGTLLKFKVMAIMVPWIRPDDDSNLGIVHLSE